MKTYIQHYPACWNQGVESWGIYVSRHRSHATIFVNNVYSLEGATTEYVAYFYIKNCNLYDDDPIEKFMVRSKSSKRIAFKHFKKLLTCLTDIYENRK